MQATDDAFPGFIESMIESGVLKVSQKLPHESRTSVQHARKLMSHSSGMQAKKGAPKFDKTKMKETHRRLLNSTIIVSAELTRSHRSLGVAHLTTLLTSSPQEEEDFGLPEGSLPEEIIGGSDVEKDAMQYLVSIGKESLLDYVPGGHACGGTIIAPNVILSSASEYPDLNSAERAPVQICVGC